jgi:hypothetical protein
MFVSRKIITEVRTDTVDGWLVSDPTSWVPAYYGEAAAAQRVVTAESRQLAENGVSNVICIEWNPTTPMGTRVVRALTDGAVSA